MTNNHSSARVSTIPSYAAGVWKVHQERSEIAFSVRQLGVRVHGRFTDYEITIETGTDPLDSSVNVSIDLSSIDTGNARRDTHVRSPTFLDVRTHPTAVYRSTSVRPGEDGWVVDGDLTLHGITRAVPLAVSAAWFGPDPDGGRRARFSATAVINRGEFEINRWTGGGLLVGDRIPITIWIQATRQ